MTVTSDTGIARRLERKGRVRPEVRDAASRRRLTVGMLLQTGQQLTGINAVMYYGPQIFAQAIPQISDANLLAQGILGVVNVPRDRACRQTDCSPDRCTGSTVEPSQLVCSTLGTDTLGSFED